LRLGKLLPRIGRNYFYLMHLSYGGEDRAELWDYAYRNNLIGLDYEGVDEDWLTIPESNRNKIVPSWGLCSGDGWNGSVIPARSGIG
jgi:hypothetical protein